MTLVNTIGLCSMIDSSIQKLKQPQLIALVATLIGLLPLPAVASSVDIYRWTTKGDRVTLRVKILDDERIPVQGLISQNFQVQTTDKDGNNVILKPNQIRLISPEQSPFLTTLREYEITYKQPGADRATKHSTTVKVNSSSRKINNIASDPKQITMGNFIYTTLPFKERLSILGFTALFAIVGLFAFKGWSKHLKEEAERNLQQTDR